MGGILRTIGRSAAKLLPKRPYPVLAGPLKGCYFVLGSFAGEGGGASVFVDLSEREQTAAFVREVLPGYTVFDIGANVGYYTILASRLVGPQGMVAAFEPVPRNIDFLQEHISLNNAANVLVVPLACSDTPGTTSFYLGSNFATGSLHGAGEQVVSVDKTTLDEFIEREGLIPDVIKIDVEGAEIEVLAGGRHTIPTHKPTIFLSTHSPELRESCKEVLEKYGYKITALILSDDPHEFLAKHPEKE